MPRTHRSFIAVGTPQGAGLWRIEGESVLPDWNAGGIPAGKLGGMSGRNGTLWAGELNNDALWRYDCRSNESQRFALDSLSPQALCAGERYLLIADSSREQIGFWDMRKNRIVHRVAVGGLGGACGWQSGRFFVSAVGRVDVFNERALARQAQVHVPEARSFLRIYGERDDALLLDAMTASGRKAMLLDFNTLEIRAVVAEAYRKVALNPFIRQQFGTEWTQPRLQLDAQGRFSPEILPDSARDFEADFFESRLFVILQDSLKAFEMSSGQQRWSTALPTGAWLSGSWHDVAPAAD